MTGPQPGLTAWFNSRASAPDLVLPRYAGGCVGNLAASVLAAFDIDIDIDADRPDALLPAVESNLLDPRRIAGSRVLVLVVIDGLGLEAFERARVRGAVPGLASCGEPRRLTSVFPSTTAAALTSIQNGRAPAQHGMAGYTLNLPHAGRVVNMITFKPVDGGAFTRPAPDPLTMALGPTLFERLAAGGVTSVVVSHREYGGSPLTKAQSREAPFVGHRSLAEFAALTLRAATDAAAAGERRFVFAYWAGFDTLAHTYGPDSAECALELGLVDHALRVGLLEPLAAAGDDVTVLVTADHGVATLDPHAVRYQSDIVAATGGWRHPPTGERRALGLALGDTGAAARLAELVGEAGVVLPAHSAIEHGLYGPGPLHPELDERIGDTLLLARNGASFPYRASRENPDLTSGGAHGSLTSAEMYVPLLAQRFGHRAANAGA
jgi:hypothetical protein